MSMSDRWAAKKCHRVWSGLLIQGRINSRFLKLLAACACFLYQTYRPEYITLNQMVKHRKVVKSASERFVRIARKVAELKDDWSYGEFCLSLFSQKC